MTHPEWVATVTMACGIILSGGAHVAPDRARLTLAIGAIVAGTVALIMLLVPA